MSSVFPVIGKFGTLNLWVQVRHRVPDTKCLTWEVLCSEFFSNALGNKKWRKRLSIWIGKIFDYCNEAQVYLAAPSKQYMNVINLMSPPKDSPCETVEFIFMLSKGDIMPHLGANFVCVYACPGRVVLEGRRTLKAEHPPWAFITRSYNPRILLCFTPLMLSTERCFYLWFHGGNQEKHMSIKTGAFWHWRRFEFEVVHCEALRWSHSSALGLHRADRCSNYSVNQRRFRAEFVNCPTYMSKI